MSGQDYRVPPQSRSSIRDGAKTLREKLRISSVYFPIMEVLELALPKLLDGYEFLVGSLEDMEGTHGLTFPQENRIILREDVYHGALEGNGRDRMTAAHELGHLLLHKNIAFARSLPGVDVKPYESSEWQAKCFSGELLVPASFSASLIHMEPEQLALTCGVSIEAARYQLKALKNPY